MSLHINPLNDLHRQAEAEFQNYGEIEIVSTFGEPQAEYAAIRKSAGMMDLPQRGIIRLSGKDRLTFLNNLITNQVFDKQKKSGIPAGAGVYAFLLNAKSGRIQTDVNVLERGDHTLLEMDSRIIAPTLVALEKYLFSEQVKIEDQSGVLHEIALHGPKAREILGVEELPALGSTNLKFFDVDVTVWRDDPTGAPGYLVIMPQASARVIWMNLAVHGLAQSAGQSALSGKRPEGARPTGWAAFNATRIEAGRALFGIDFDDSILPAETSEFSRAVSLTKGCYPGQEIVARMHARGQVARQIAGIRMADDALPIAGTKISDDAGNEIGAITSSTISPVLSNAAICLGLLKRPHFNAGTVVNIPAEGSIRKGTVVQLPFWKSP